MNTHQEEALNAFRSGMNCAQSVLAAFTDITGMDRSQALKVSSGFGGGMGRLQLTCGAVTGAFMVLGLANCRKYTDPAEIKDANNRMIQAFHKKFLEVHRTSCCAELLNCDLKTEEGRMHMTDHRLEVAVCELCVTTAVRILEDLLA